MTIIENLLSKVLWEEFYGGIIKGKLLGSLGLWNIYFFYDNYWEPFMKSFIKSFMKWFYRGIIKGKLLGSLGLWNIYFFYEMVLWNGFMKGVLWKGFYERGFIEES
jgi:hypothetical protein